MQLTSAEEVKPAEWICRNRQLKELSFHCIISREANNAEGVERWLSWSKALAWKASRWGKTLSRGFESLSLRHFLDLAVLDGEVAVS